MRHVALSIASVLTCLACAGGEVADDGAPGAGGVANAAGTSAAGTSAAGTGASTSGTGGGAGKGGGAGPANAGASGSNQGQGGTGSVAGAAGTGASSTTGGAGDGSAGTNATGASGCDLTWPTPTDDENVSDTIEVDDGFDGEMKRFIGTGALGTSGGSEDQGAIFRLAEGAVLENVILGNPAADGIHCEGSCTLRNVWWEDVGEDAATLEGDDDSQTMLIECGGARRAADKVFQHNGPGTLIVRNFTVEDFGKLYRSCGNCDDQFTRHSLFEDIVARSGGSIAGVNENYGDTAEFHRIVIYGNESGTPVCVRWQGNDTGAEPNVVGDGPDGEHCSYRESDVEYR